VDESRFASGSSGGSIRVWSANDNECQSIISMPSKASVYALTTLWQYRPGIPTLASGNKKGTVELWDVDDGTCLLQLPLNTRLIRALCEMADGRVVCGANELSLLDLRKEKQNDVNSIQIQSESSMGVIVSSVEDTQSKTKVMLKSAWLIGSCYYVRDLKEGMIFSSSMHQTHFWNLDTNDIKSITFPTRIISISSRTPRVLVVGDDNGVRIWDWRSEKLLLRPFVNLRAALVCSDGSLAVVSDTINEELTESKLSIYQMWNSTDSLVNMCCCAIAGWLNSEESLIDGLSEFIPEDLLLLCQRFYRARRDERSQR